MKRALDAISGSSFPPSKNVRLHTGVADPSLRDKEVGRFKSAVARCFSQLEDIGVKSPRFLKVEEARRVGNMGAISLQENAFIGRFSSHKSLDCARRKFEAFIIFFTGLQKTRSTSPSGMLPLGSLTRLPRGPVGPVGPSRP